MNATAAALVARSWAVDRPVRTQKGIQIGRWLHDVHLRAVSYLPTGDERDIAAFRGESNTERRRLIWEACGMRIIEVMDLWQTKSDDWGSLWRSRGMSLGCLLLKVVNSTPELDGSYKDYWLRVPHNMSTPKEAIAWTFGMTEKEYAPQHQS